MLFYPRFKISSAFHWTVHYNSRGPSIHRDCLWHSDCSNQLLIPTYLIIIFPRLFETHPEVQSVFMPFKSQNCESLMDNVQLKSHALRVMGTVDKCINRFHDPAKVRDMLHELGARHVMYNAKVDYMDVSTHNHSKQCQGLPQSF